MTQEQVESLVQEARQLGIERIGIHAMLSSNELDAKRYAENSTFLLRFVREVEEKYNTKIEFLNIGGGIGIPYQEAEKPFDIVYLGQAVQKAYEELGFKDLKIFMECGRFITGPYGYLVTTVNNVKETYRKYIQVDASMHNLMRPGMYDAYHSISILGKENEEENEVYDVVGSLCENNDKFAKQRTLPKVSRGDILVLHDAGAHGHTMGFNYNGKLRSAEFLWNRESGQYHLIRRAETLEDLFATLVA
jgi:diaminopimelate decarboxylase